MAETLGVVGPPRGGPPPTQDGRRYMGVGVGFFLRVVAILICSTPLKLFFLGVGGLLWGGGGAGAGPPPPRPI